MARLSEVKGDMTENVMNIFAYRGRYRTVTGTRYTEVQVCPTAKYACISLGANRPQRFKPSAMHITLGGENCRLVCKLGTCIPSLARAQACMPVYLFRHEIHALSSAEQVK